MPIPSAESMGLPSWVDNPSSLSWNDAPAASTGSPAKPGFDWMAAGAAASDLFGGIGDIIRGYRGEPPAYRMAGSRLGEYLQNQKEETYLADLLKTIIGKSMSELGSFDPTKRQPV